MIMSGFDCFLELDYGKLFALDLHGQTLEEARANLIHTLTTIDNSYNGLLIIHGYHKGRVLRDYIREKFKHKNVYKKVHLDASRTILLFAF